MTNPGYTAKEFKKKKKRTTSEPSLASKWKFGFKRAVDSKHMRSLPER